MMQGFTVKIASAFFSFFFCHLQELSDPPQSQEEGVTFTKVSEVVDVPGIEPRVDVSCKAEKPKRSVGLRSMLTVSLCGPKQNNNSGLLLVIGLPWIPIVSTEGKIYWPGLLIYTALQHIFSHSIILFTLFILKKYISNHLFFISHHLLFK